MKITHPDNPLQCMHVNVSGTGTVRHCTGFENGTSELAYAPALGIWTNCGRFFAVPAPRPGHHSRSGRPGVRRHPHGTGFSVGGMRPLQRR